MENYFEKLINELDDKNMIITSCNIVKCEMNHTFSIFKSQIDEKVKYLYNNYKEFQVNWEDSNKQFHGFVQFIPYDEILKEHKMLSEIAESAEEGLIEDQEMVTNDLKNWYPIFKFPNGDAFCYDKRDNKIVFLNMKYLIWE